MQGHYGRVKSSIDIPKHTVDVISPLKTPVVAASSSAAPRVPNTGALSTVRKKHVDEEVIVDPAGSVEKAPAGNLYII